MRLIDHIKNVQIFLKEKSGGLFLTRNFFAHLFDFFLTQNFFLTFFEFF